MRRCTERLVIYTVSSSSCVISVTYLFAPVMRAMRFRAWPGSLRKRKEELVLQVLITRRMQYAGLVIVKYLDVTLETIVDVDDPQRVTSNTSKPCNSGNGNYPYMKSTKSVHRRLFEELENVRNLRRKNSRKLELFTKLFGTQVKCSTCVSCHRGHL